MARQLYWSSTGSHPSTGRNQSCSSVGRISELEGLRLRRRKRRGGWVWGGSVSLFTGEGSGQGAVPPPQKKFVFFCVIITRLWCTLTPFWSNFITGWKLTTMHKMVHFAMLQTTKYCSRIQVRTHSAMLAMAPPNGWFCANCASSLFFESL